MYYFKTFGNLILVRNTLSHTILLVSLTMAIFVDKTWVAKRAWSIINANVNRTPNIVAGVRIIFIYFFLCSKNAFSNTLHPGVRLRSRSFGSIDRCKNNMHVMVVMEVVTVAVIVAVVVVVLVTGSVNGAKAEQICFVQRVFKSRFFFVIRPDRRWHVS